MLLLKNNMPLSCTILEFQSMIIMWLQDLLKVFFDKSSTITSYNNNKVANILIQVVGSL